MHRALTHMHQANRLRLAGTGGYYLQSERESGVRAGQGEGRCTGTHVQGHGKMRLEDKRPCRKVRAQHAQILTPSPVRPEAAQPAADSPAPCTVPPRQAPLSGCHAEPISATSPLMCPAEAVPVGAAAASRWGSRQPTAPCSPVASRGEMHFQRSWGLVRAALCRAKGRAEPLRKWLSPVLPTREQQRWLVCSRAYGREEWQGKLSCRSNCTRGWAGCSVANLDMGHASCTPQPAAWQEAVRGLSSQAWQQMSS